MGLRSSGEPLRGAVYGSGTPRSEPSGRPRGGRVLAAGGGAAAPAKTSAMPSFALRAGVGPRRGGEVSLVGPSMRALGAGRRGCAHCRRTPLVGEKVFF